VHQLKIKAFQCMRKTNLTAWFRVWRIEALRRAYQRESADYQTMLSVTAASLSRKDIAIAEAEAKVTSMARIIDSLTESNKQLSHRVDQLENLSAAASFVGGGDEGDESRSGFGDMDTRRRHGGALRRRETNYERIDTLLTQDDERMDRTNRMLLETMFGMARMVETCAIQMSKDMMDSLELQLDGGVLQHLAEMVQRCHAHVRVCTGADRCYVWRCVGRSKPRTSSKRRQTRPRARRVSPRCTLQGTPAAARRPP